MDDAIAQVAAVTGTTTELAAQYVQLADGDANQAVQLFFENGGADLAAGSTASTSNPRPTTSRASVTGNAQNPIDLDKDNVSDDNDPEVTGFRKVSRPPDEPRHITGSNFDDDEAMARRLQEEMYGDGDVPIRAPIARQTETLLGPGADAGPLSSSELDAAVQARMAAMQRRRGQGYRPGIFNQHQPTANIWQSEGGEAPDPLAEATGGASEATTRSNMLARLFQPPWDLMYKGSWEDARDEGKDQKKWILVSIQDGSVFDCQALNRDLWKNEGVVETVKENFIFLQYSKDDPRADSYIQFYFPGHESPDMYPHVAIVDPRTGEQIKLWSRKVPQAAEFLMQLHEFLDRYSLENNVRNPVAKRKSEAKKEKSIDQMTEEEMLERALQASMATQTAGLQPPTIEDPDDLTRSVGDVRATPAEADKSKSDAMSIYENSTQNSEASVFSLIPSDRPHSEPDQGPGITRLQIRHPGGRIVRRFAQNDPVQRIYEFLKAEPLEGKGGAEFELVSMGKNLLDFRQETIEEAGLKNGTVMVEFVNN